MSFTAHLHVQLHQQRVRRHQLWPLSSWPAALLWVSWKMRSLTKKHLLFPKPLSPIFIVSASLCVCSYSLVPQNLCIAYFTQLADADFSVFSSSLGYKQSALFTNAKSCLVSPLTAVTEVFISSRNTFSDWILRLLAFLQGITSTSLTQDTVAVLGNMCCTLDASYIVNSDPSILEKLKNCPDLTSAQVAAVEALLLSGNTQYGYVCPVSTFPSSLTRTGFQLDHPFVFPSLGLHRHGTSRLWRLSIHCRSIWPLRSMKTSTKWVKHAKTEASCCWFSLTLLIFLNVPVIVENQATFHEVLPAGPEECRSEQTEEKTVQEGNYKFH